MAEPVLTECCQCHIGIGRLVASVKKNSLPSAVTEHIQVKLIKNIVQCQ